MKELRRLLEEDVKCYGKYEFLHYKESDSLDFNQTVLKKLKEIERETSQTMMTDYARDQMPEIVEDSDKKHQ